MRSVALEYKIVWQFKYRKWQEDLYGKKLLEARLALQQHFPIQILLVFLRFKLLPNFIFQCYRLQTWQFYLLFSALSISAIPKVLNLRVVGRMTLVCLLSLRCSEAHLAPLIQTMPCPAWAAPPIANMCFLDYRQD